MKNDCKNAKSHFQITFSLSSTSCLLKLPIGSFQLQRIVQLSRLPFTDCSYPMDIALAIDSSGSVGRRSFQLVKAFLKVFTHHFEVTNTTHFACLHYDHRVYKNFKFKDTQYHNHPSLDAKIQSMRYLGGATLTDQALTVAKTFFFRRNGARNKRKVKRAVVLMTDGKTYYGVPSLVHPTYELKVP